MNFFKFKDKSSLDFNTLIVNELPPIIKPSEKVERHDLSGRHGELIITSGKYSTMTKSIECTIKGLSEIDEIVAWLTGAGMVTFSNQPDRYYNATIINKIPFERAICQFRKIVVEFECQPFGNLLKGQDIISLVEPGEIINRGTVESDPVITITGKGDIELTIGQQILKLSGVESTITIDSQLLEVYKGSEVQNKKFKGKFPTIPVGGSSISWRGPVDSVEIKPNWRCL